MNFRVTPAAGAEILAAAKRSGAQGMALRVGAGTGCGVAQPGPVSTGGCGSGGCGGCSR